ncbi:hypothetical protein M3Y98_00424700 [Aphelenchoides besseyi]|nr:hypothetical protein M3Y98_00424700 [Aphelenchoides besseyi]
MSDGFLLHAFQSADKTLAAPTRCIIDTVDEFGICVQEQPSTLQIDSLTLDQLATLLLVRLTLLHRLDHRHFYVMARTRYQFDSSARFTDYFVDARVTDR